MAFRTATGLTALLALVLIGLAGCGGSGSDTEPPPAAGINAPNAPSLLTDSKAPGEFVFQAGYSPRTFGPVTLKGRYLVRFAQYAPEDAHMDFSQQTVFMAKLIKVTGKGPSEVPLFLKAARSGQTRVMVDGSYKVDVSFGDFPFVVRLTPA
jgi:hypothetical protein